MAVHPSSEAPESAVAPAPTASTVAPTLSCLPATAQTEEAVEPTTSANVVQEFSDEQERYGLLRTLDALTWHYGLVGDDAEDADDPQAQCGCQPEPAFDSNWTPTPCPNRRHQGDLCKRNTCTTCGPWHAARLATASIAAEPNVFLTFTRGDDWNNQFLAIAEMLKYTRSMGVDLTGVYAFEAGGRTGRLHAHMVARVPGGWTERLQAVLTAAAVYTRSGDVVAEPIRNVAAATRYVLKNTRRNLAQHLDLNGGRIAYPTRGFLLQPAPKVTTARSPRRRLTGYDHYERRMGR